MIKNNQICKSLLTYWMQVSKALIVVIILVGSTFANSESLEYSNLVKQATSGNSNASLTIGFMYEYGEGLPQNYRLAFKWFLQAAKQKNNNAQTKVAFFYQNGLGVKQDYKKALFWFKKAGNKNSEAQYEIGQIYFQGLGVKINKNKAQKWFLRAAKNGHYLAQYKLGEIYYLGDGVEVDYHKAFSWYEKAAIQHFAPAQYKLGLFYQYGKLKSKNQKIANNFFRMAFDSGILDAGFLLATNFLSDVNQANNIGAIELLFEIAQQNYSKASFYLWQIYINGWYGQVVDYEFALHWYQLATINMPSDELKAQLKKGYYDFFPEPPDISKELDFENLERAIQMGDTKAKYDLAWLSFYGGKNIKPNMDLVVELLSSATVQGYVPAMYFLGKLFQKQQKLPQAKKWFSLSAQKGFAPAMHQLAMFEIIDNNYPVAEKWLQQAVQQNFSMSQYQLAVLYIEDKLKPPDSNTGLKLLEDSAQFGNYLAQYKLGQLYFKGEKVNPNIEKAIKWMQEAAMQSYTKAQLELSEMLFSAPEVDNHEVRGYAWYLLAIENNKGKPLAVTKNLNIKPENIKKAKKLKEKIKSSMVFFNL